MLFKILCILSLLYIRIHQKTCDTLEGYWSRIPKTLP